MLTYCSGFAFWMCSLLFVLCVYIPAHLLDYYIVQLVGPKISSLKVRDRDRYHFKPRELLQEIVGTWLHLASEKAFLEKVATDERSYKPAVFSKAARILRKRDILPERAVQQFEGHLRTLAELHESLQALESILGDLPDEFTDGLMGTLMTDPVQLPQSRQFVDRATIARQLLNKSVDPFSNTPLTLEQLIEVPQLKQEIAQWVEERKQAWRANKAAEEAAAAASGAGGGAEEEDEEDVDDASSVATTATAASASSAASSQPAPPSVKKSYLDD
jgi:ubiquitin conjugation factor E4 B